MACPLTGMAGKRALVLVAVWRFVGRRPAGRAMDKVLRMDEYCNDDNANNYCVE